MWLFKDCPLHFSCWYQLSAALSQHTLHIDAAGASTLIIPLRGVKGFVLSLPKDDKYTLDPSQLCEEDPEFATEDIFSITETQLVVLFPGHE